MTISQPLLGILAVEGTDAKKFLQGQLTCNLEEISADHTRLGAHCAPDGRVISLFHIKATNQGYQLQMPKSLVPIAINALKKYAVFFKVTLTDQSTDAVYPINEEIEQGIPHIYPETSGKFLPHEINLPALHAVSFNKGCYTGQEIIARMHYRAKLKKQLYAAKVTTSIAITPGQNIYDTETQAGFVVDVFQKNPKQFALLVIANIADVANKPLYIDPNKQYPLEFKHNG